MDGLRDLQEEVEEQKGMGTGGGKASAPRNAGGRLEGREVGCALDAAADEVVLLPFVPSHAIRVSARVCLPLSPNFSSFSLFLRLYFLSLFQLSFLCLSISVFKFMFLAVFLLIYDLSISVPTEMSFCFLSLCLSVLIILPSVSAIPLVIFFFMILY